MTLRFLFILLFLATSIICFAQTPFERGYFFDKEGKKTECFFKKFKRNVCPEEFKYRLTAYGRTHSLNVNDVSELGIDGGQQFYSFTVLADLTRMNTGKTSTERKRNISQETLFFIPLVIGEVSLFQYLSNGNSIFFVKKGNNIPKQLIQKPYADKSPFKKHLKVSDYYKEMYLNALWKEFRCGDITAEEMLEYEYLRRDLTSYFKDYNKCMGFNFVDVSPKKKKKSKR